MEFSSKLENNLDGLIRNEDFGPLKADEVKNGDEVEAVVVNIDTKKIELDYLLKD